VLPAPFGPSRPTTSPCWTKTETSSTTRRPRYVFDISLVSSLLIGDPAVIARAFGVVAPGVESNMSENLCGRSASFTADTALHWAVWRSRYQQPIIVSKV